MITYFSMENKKLLLCGECQCKNSFEKFIEQCSNFNQVYSNIYMLAVVFDNNNYGIDIESLKNKLSILYVDIDKIKLKTTIRNMYNKPCNEEIFGKVFNEILLELRKKNYETIDYLIYVNNITHKNTIPINKLIQITNKHPNFDIIFANDLENPIFYYAYRCEKNPTGIEILGKHWTEEIKKNIQQTIQTTTDEYVPILSGYSSISIFNMNILRDINVNCSCIPSYDLDYYYRTICNDIIITTQETINDTLMGMYIFEDSPIFYRLHNSLNFPIVHPFVNICFTISKNKKPNIFICKTLTR